MLIIFKRPQSRLLFLFRKAASVRVFPALFSCGGKESRLSKASVFLRIDHNIPVQQLNQLVCSHLDNIVPLPGLLQKPVRVKQDARSEGHPRRLAGVAFQPHHQRSCDKGRQKHNHKGQRITGIVGPQGKARNCKQKVKHQHADNRRNQAVDLVFRHQSCQQHAEHVDGNNVGLINTQIVKEKSNQAGGD